MTPQLAGIAVGDFGAPVGTLQDRRPEIIAPWTCSSPGFERTRRGARGRPLVRGRRADGGEKAEAPVRATAADAPEKGVLDSGLMLYYMDGN